MEGMEEIFLTEKEAGLRDILQNKVEETLRNKSKDIQSVIEKVERDNELLDDFIIPAHLYSFVLGEKIQMSFQDNSFEENNIKTWDITDFAMGQIGDKIGIPSGYLKEIANG